MTDGVNLGRPAMTVQFLIVADRTPSDLARAVSWRVYRARDSPLDPREIWSYAHWDEPHPPPSSFHAVLSATPPALDKPRWAQTMRAYARSVATQTDGLLIDWVARETVLAPSRPERATFLLGDQWLGFAHDVHEERHRLPQTQACAAVSHRTRGLVRFGLPELGIDGVDCGNRHVALNVLRALAQHLVFGRRPQSVGRLQKVPPEAFRAYWGATIFDGDGFPASLTTSGGVSWVGPPDGEPLNDWLAAMGMDLQSLAGCPPDDFATYDPLVLAVT
jgi:hypothetical protein